MKARILLVDDRRANLIALEAVLDAPDREMVRAESGAEALLELEARDFAVVLLDVQMPVMDGFETARKIKELPRSRHVPIIFVTAIDHDPARVTEAYRMGAVDFIHKPFEPDLMRGKVSVFVALYQAREQVRRQTLAIHATVHERLRERELNARGEADRLAAALAEADRLKQEFLATLGAELRAPLTAILGWTRMLRDGSLREAQRGRALDTIERNAGVQLCIIEEMIDISHITSGKLSLVLAPVELLSIVEQALEQARPLAAEKKVGLHASLARDVESLPGDANRLRQIVSQLVGNAVKFTPTGGVVTVSLRAAGSDVEIAVEDSGAGIDADRLPGLFDRFDWSKGGPSTNDRQGVGLAIVRHLVELHDGSVRAESAGTGQGCRFVVLLPAAGPKPRKPTAAA